MKSRPLGNTGIEASVIGLGTWAIGGWDWHHSKEKDAEIAILAALDEGINLIDTAPVYGFGKSEEVVGRAIRSRREEVIIASKCGLIWQDPPPGKGRVLFTDHRGRSIYQCNHPKVIRAELEQSLQRLKVDYIDLYQTHWQDPTCPISETMGTLVALQQEGKIRAIGVCNASRQQMEQYREAGSLASDQELFNLIDQGIRGHHLSYTRENGIAVLTYSTLALGLLSARLDPDRTFEEKDYRRTNPRFSPDNRRKIQDFLLKLEPMARDYQLSIAQLVLTWTAAVPGVTHLLCGASSPEQARDNAKAGKTSIRPADFKKLDRIAREAMPDLPPARQAQE